MAQGLEMSDFLSKPAGLPEPDTDERSGPVELGEIRGAESGLLALLQGLMRLVELEKTARELRGASRYLVAASGIFPGDRRRGRGWRHRAGRTKSRRRGNFPSTSRDDRGETCCSAVARARPRGLGPGRRTPSLCDSKRGPGAYARWSGASPASRSASHSATTPSMYSLPQ